MEMTFSGTVNKTNENGNLIDGDGFLSQLRVDIQMKLLKKVQQIEPNSGKKDNHTCFTFYGTYLMQNKFGTSQRPIIRSRSRTLVVS